MSSYLCRRWLVGVSWLLIARAGLAQEANKQNVQSNPAPLTLTLQDALARAHANEPQFHAALTDRGLAHENTVQSRAALLPAVNYNAAYLYTQGNGTSTGRFVGANGVHEYISQGTAQQAFSLQNIAEYRRARAAEGQAKTKHRNPPPGAGLSCAGAPHAARARQAKKSHPPHNGG